MDYGIVMGSPRSGTTFLMRVLNTLLNVECITGTVLPVSIPHVVNRDLSPEVYETLATGFERALDDYVHSGRVRSRAAALQKWVWAPSGLSGLGDAVQGKRSIQMLIYKEPFLSLSPEFVLDALPDAKIIYIYRDGRDVANSLVKSYDVLTDEKLTDLKSSEMRMGRPYDHRFVPWWVEDGREEEFIDSSPYVRSIWMWKYMVRRCHETFSASETASGEIDVFKIRYEDFMQSPLVHGKALLKYLDHEPSVMFKPQLRKAHTDSIGKHRERDPGEIAAAEEIAGAELDMHNYR